MKVLVTGRAILTQPDRCTGQQLCEGFRQAGHDCTFYGNFYSEPYRWLGAEEATTSQFDLIVITEMNDGYPQYELNSLNLKGTPRLFWDFDVSYHPDLSYGRAKSYNADAYLVGNRYFCGPDGFGRFGKPVLHLPYACSPQIHRQLEGEKKAYYLGFIGSMTEERKRLITLAKSVAARPGFIHSADGVFGDDLIRQTNQYHVMFHNNQDACKGLVPGRPWETTGCGTTLLMDYTSYMDFVEFLPIELHDSIFMYKDDYDIRKWLSLFATWNNKEEELLAAGKRLMHYVHANHTYKHRAESIIQWTKEQGITT